MHFTFYKKEQNMKKYLLPKNGNFYKANMHCHTTISDGGLTPEQIKEGYMKHGYSIVAFTDHHLFIRHNDLSDENFLALNGYEVDVTEPGAEKPWFRRKTCHLCFIALDPDIEYQPVFHRSKFLTKFLENNPDAKFDDSRPDYVKVYSAEGVNDMIKKAKEAGFYVTYNHPTWSLEQYPEYIGYEGMDAMELLNFHCFAAGYDEYNPHAYEDLLKAGRRIAAVYSDDCHSRNFEDVMTDLCGGFVMIKADKLEYKTITDAMKRGDYYASMGPEIKDAYIEDGKLYVKTTPVRQICMNYGYRAKGIVKAQKGETVTEAVFDVRLDVAEAENTYFRISLIDSEGNRADTRAYFFDEDGIREAAIVKEEPLA